MKPQPTTATPPAPVTLAEAREYCKIIGRDDDARLAVLIGAATKTVERDTRTHLAARGYSHTFVTCSPGEAVTLRPSPLVSVDRLAAVDQAGTETELDLADFDVDTENRPGIITPKRHHYWPAADCFRIEYTTGHAAVPDDLRLLVLMLVLHWNESPEAVSEANLRTVPLGYRHMVASIDPHEDAIR